jgi:hypothetical protein
MRFLLRDVICPRLRRRELLNFCVGKFVYKIFKLYTCSSDVVSDVFEGFVKLLRMLLDFLCMRFVCNFFSNFLYAQIVL